MTLPADGDALLDRLIWLDSRPTEPAAMRRRRAVTRFPLLVVAAACTAAAISQDLSGPVVRVTDGDSIEVELAGLRERVRYIGVDSPEMTDERPQVRAAAVAAREANVRLVGGRNVRLELDVEKRDRYGRLLAYVWVGDTLVNELLVREGFARPLTIPPNVRYVDRYQAAARLARADADAPTATRTVAPGEAIDHVGRVVRVCGRVASTRYLRNGRSDPTFLNFGRAYPDQDFTAVIFGEHRARFAEAPDVRFRGREACATGEVSLYRGDPQIVVTDPSQIQLVE